jgi:3-deoxy-7-phosphoheptulonate synthase
VGRQSKPVLLKRGMSATIEEWLLAAEYILAEGNPRVMLCERGIRTFEPLTRFTFDINARPGTPPWWRRWRVAPSRRGPTA